MGNERMGFAQRLTAEAVVAVVIAGATVLYGLGRVEGHRVLFESQVTEYKVNSQEDLEELSARLESRFADLKQRTEILENRDRDSLSILTRLDTQVGQVHDDLSGLKDVVQRLVERIGALRIPSRQ